MLERLKEEIPVDIFEHVIIYAVVMIKVVYFSNIHIAR